MKPLVRLRHTGGLIVTGIPFGRDRLRPSDGLHADIPLWWDVRSLWPDGSVKWLMLHARADAPGELAVFAGGGPPRRAAFDGNALISGNCSLSFPGGMWRWDTPQACWRLESDETLMPGLRQGEEWTVRLLEDSPVAPLLLLSRPGGLTVEWLLRQDAEGGSLFAARRVSACGEGLYALESSSVALSCAGATFPARAVDAAGLDDLTVEQEGRGVRLFDAGARRPARMVGEGSSVLVSLWPEDAGRWPVTGGTSFRHELCVYDGGFRPPARVSFEPGYLAGTGAFSSCYTAGEDPDRLLFPGFEAGCRRLLDAGRLEALKDDPACFGLFHFGDWPLNPGQYGAAGRAYADNEYDTPYAYYQGFAAFGKREYLDAARRCAVHMADVDCDCITGDMRYHGYSGEAENHAERRAPEGDTGHRWADGMWLAWFLHGDPWCRRAAMSLTKYVCGQFAGDETALRRAWAVCERNLGWPLVLAVSACEAGENPEAYALASRICAYIARFARDPDAEYEGGLTDGDGPLAWWRTAMKDGCKPFMLGVILEGLERFHRLTGSRDAADAIVSLARYLADTAWKPWHMDFTYEINAYGRGHRDINAQQLTPLFLRGMGYAFELTGDARLRDIAMRAFHACLWTLHAAPPNGKDIALTCRSLGAFAAMARRWAEDDGRAARAALPRSPGGPFHMEGMPEGTFELPGAYSDEGSFALAASFAKGSSDCLNLRALLHLDGGPGGCAVSVVTFYDFFSVRFFDRSGMLVETLDGKLSACVPGGWREGGEHRVGVCWRAPGWAEFVVDGFRVDGRGLNRTLSGRFTRLFVGGKPGGWRVKGLARLESLALGPGSSGLPARQSPAGKSDV